MGTLDLIAFLTISQFWVVVFLFLGFFLAFKKNLNNHLSNQSAVDLHLSIKGLKLIDYHLDRKMVSCSSKISCV